MAKSLVPFPGLMIYMPKKGQQKVSVFETGKEDIQGGKECVLGIDVSPWSDLTGIQLSCTGSIWFSSDPSLHGHPTLPKWAEGVVQW